MATVEFDVAGPTKRVSIDLDDVDGVLIRRVPARRDNPDDPEEITTPKKVLLRVFLGEDEHANCELDDLDPADRATVVEACRAIVDAAVATDPRLSLV
jgi:hypothetical protein